MKKYYCIMALLLMLMLVSCENSTAPNVGTINYRYTDIKQTENVSENQLLVGHTYYLYVTYDIKHMHGSSNYSFISSVNFNDNAIITCVDSPADMLLNGNIININFSQKIGTEYTVVYKIDAKSAGTIRLSHSALDNLSLDPEQVVITIVEEIS